LVNGQHREKDKAQHQAQAREGVRDVTKHAKSDCTGN
jgi:hypothetical protein